MSTQDDEAVSQFLALTDSSDAAQAKSYLEMSANDLQTAINLYLEHQGGGGGMSSASTGTGNGGGMGSASASASFGGGLSGGFDDVRAPDKTHTDQLLGGHNDNMGMFMGMPPGIMNNPLLRPHLNVAGLQNDQATAPHLSAFSNSPSSNGVPGLGLGFSGIMDDGDATTRLAGNVRDFINASASTNGRGVGNDNALNSQNDAMEESDDEVQITGPPSASASLKDLFAAPVHLIHSAGGFQGARNVAKDSRRWLLVNLQRDADFACHALNRDVWRNELVEYLVREGFIFWQSLDTSPDGQIYAQRYNVQSYPHIGIIDPRTSRLVFRKEGWTQENPLTAERFAELATDFCSSHSFDRAPSIPRGASNSSSAGGVTASASSSSTMNAPAATVDRMTEEEQLQAAIRASMNEASGMNDDDDDDDDISENDEYIMPADSDDDVKIASGMSNDEDMDTREDCNDKVVVAEAPKEVTFHDEIVAMDVGEEPTGTNGVARIMIRMPDGKRLVRKFNLNDTVKMIYAFVSQSSDDAKAGKEFELKAGFPPKNLLPIVDDTIASSGLAGDSVTVRWKEE